MNCFRALNPDYQSNLVPFLLSRKKILDFYQRACLSGYCSAFAYKPMQGSLSSQLNGKCVELASGPCLFSGLELSSSTPSKHPSSRNSWSSDGMYLGHPKTSSSRAAKYIMLLVTSSSWSGSVGRSHGLNYMTKFTCWMCCRHVIDECVGHVF